METLIQAVKDIVDLTTKYCKKSLQTSEVVNRVNNIKEFRHVTHSTVYGTLKVLEKRKLINCGYLGLGSSRKEGVCWWSEKIRIYLPVEDVYLKDKEKGIELLIKLNKENNGLEIDRTAAERFLNKK